MTWEFATFAWNKTTHTYLIAHITLQKSIKKKLIEDSDYDNTSDSDKGNAKDETKTHKNRKARELSSSPDDSDSPLQPDDKKKVQHKQLRTYVVQWYLVYGCDSHSPFYTTTDYHVLSWLPCGSPRAIEM